MLKRKKDVRMVKKKQIKIKMESVIANAKRGKQTPFFLSDLKLKELEMPKQIWELPELDLCEKLVLARIHSFGEKGGEPTNNELIEFVWTKMWQIIHILANRSSVPSLFGWH